MRDCASAHEGPHVHDPDRQRASGRGPSVRGRASAPVRRPGASEKMGSYTAERESNTVLTVKHKELAITENNVKDFEKHYANVRA